MGERAFQPEGTDLHRHWSRIELGVFTKERQGSLCVWSRVSKGEGGREEAWDLGFKTSWAEGALNKSKSSGNLKIGEH